MRQGELLSLTWGDISADRKYVTLSGKATKTAKARTVPLGPRNQHMLASLRPKDASPSDRLFSLTRNAVRLAWTRTRERAGLTDLRFHDLRHEATSRCFEMGLDTMEVAAITNHETLQMLKRYAHLRTKNIAEKLKWLARCARWPATTTVLLFPAQPRPPQSAKKKGLSSGPPFFAVWWHAGATTSRYFRCNPGGPFWTGWAEPKGVYLERRAMCEEVPRPCLSQRSTPSRWRNCCTSRFTLYLIMRWPSLNGYHHSCGCPRGRLSGSKTTSTPDWRSAASASSRRRKARPTSAGSGGRAGQSAKTCDVADKARGVSPSAVAISRGQRLLVVRAGAPGGFSLRKFRRSFVWTNC